MYFSLVNENVYLDVLKKKKKPLEQEDLIHLFK